MSKTPSDPSRTGEWKVIGPRFRHLPVHIALLYNGSILAFGGSGNDDRKEGAWYPPEIFKPDYTGESCGTTYEISSSGIKGDLFCAGHAFLPDGRLFIAGGTYKYDGLWGLFPPFSGLEHTYVFDSNDLSWTRLPDMEHGRWYPTCVMLADGRVATFAGLTKRFPWVVQNRHEIYSEHAGWQELPGADKWFPLYPRIHLLPSGELFYAGSYNTHMTFPFNLGQFKIATYNFNRCTWTNLPHPRERRRQEGSTVLLPLEPPLYTARVMLIGGGRRVEKEVVNEVELIDFSDKCPSYEQIACMKHRRYYVYPVILPDRNILVVGGTSGRPRHDHRNHDCRGADHEVAPDANAVLEAELFCAENQRWKTLASMAVDRLYHASAILLPDATVMTAGSNPARRCNEGRIEIFTPPYLFRGNRPSITRCPKQVDYGQEFEIETPDAGEIESIAFIRPSNTTHCLNPEQRYVGLEFTRTRGCDVVTVKVPRCGNVLPPGYYMLFVVNSRGVPSVAEFVKVRL